jgi:hypothetical protein
MDSSRILEASSIRVNSLGPEGGAAVGCGFAAGGGTKAGNAGTAGSAAGAVETGSLFIDKEANVCVQTPGSAARGAGGGTGARLGAGCFDGSSSIWISRVIPTLELGGAASGGGGKGAEAKGSRFPSEARGAVEGRP